MTTERHTMEQENAMEQRRKATSDALTTALRDYTAARADPSSVDSVVADLMAAVDEELRDNHGIEPNP